MPESATFENLKRKIRQPTDKFPDNTSHRSQNKCIKMNILDMLEEKLDRELKQRKTEWLCEESNNNFSCTYDICVTFREEANDK